VLAELVASVWQQFLGNKLTCALRTTVKICQMLAKPFRKWLSHRLTSKNHMIAKKIGLPPNLKKMDVTQNLVEDA
jgi:hypothetical protein